MRAGKFFSGDSVGETRDINNLLVGVKELGLAAGLVFGLDDQRCQAAMGGCQPGGEARRAGTNNHDVPVREVIDVGSFVPLDDLVIAHGSAFAVAWCRATER